VQLAADTVILRSGEVVTGTIVGQNREIVRIRTEDRVRVISKAEIRRLTFSKDEATTRPEPRPEPQPQPEDKPEQSEEPVAQEAVEAIEEALEPEAGETVDVWGALWRSALLPGWGQFAQGRATAGWIYAGSFFAGGIATGALFGEASSATAAYESEATVLFVAGAPAAGGIGGPFQILTLQNRNAALDRANRANRNANAAAGILGAIYLFNLADVVLFHPTPNTSVQAYGAGDGGGLRLDLRF